MDRNNKMKKDHKEILEVITDYLEKNPELRFGQALFNLRVNEFSNRSNLEQADYKIRDIHGDSDEKILERIKSQLEWFEEQKKEDNTM